MGERESRLPNEENETMMMTFHSRRRVESYKTDRWDTRENTKAIDIFLISFCWLTFHTNDTDTLFSLLASCLFLNSLICFVFRVCLSVQLLLFLFFRGKCSCALHFGTHINNNCWSRYIYIYTKQTDGDDTSWNKGRSRITMDESALGFDLLSLLRPWILESVGSQQLSNHPSTTCQ